MQQLKTECNKQGGTKKQKENLSRCGKEKFKKMSAHNKRSNP